MSVVFLSWALFPSRRSDDEVRECDEWNDNADFPLLYRGDTEAERGGWFDKYNRHHGDLPRWARHTETTFAEVPLERLTLSHFMAAVNGTVSNKLLRERILEASKNEKTQEFADGAAVVLGDLSVFFSDDQREKMGRHAQGLEWDVFSDTKIPSLVADDQSIFVRAKNPGSKSVAEAWRILKHNLEFFADAAKLSYKREELSDEDKELVGWFGRRFGSVNHQRAVAVGIRVEHPTKAVISEEEVQKRKRAGLWDGTEQPPFERGSCDHVDLCVHLFFRGSENCHDWKVNLQFWTNRAGSKDFPRRKGSLETEKEMDIEVHHGFLYRFRCLRKPLVDFIDEVHQKTLTKSKWKEVKLRFVLVGHSQGGALACLMALALNRWYPDSDIMLVTFSAPTVFGHHRDPFNETCIRHYRFHVKRDPVAWHWLCRRHGGFLSFKIDSPEGGLLDTHGGDFYWEKVTKLYASETNVSQVLVAPQQARADCVCHPLWNAGGAIPTFRDVCLKISRAVN